MPVSTHTERIAPRLPSPGALALAAALALTARAAGAQPVEAPVEAGVRAGASWSSVTWEVPGPQSSSANRSRRGLAAGVFARWPLRGALSAQPELLVVQKGFERTEPTLHFTYLELPLLLRADVGTGALGAFALAGPAVALELRCRVSYVAWRYGPYAGDCDAPGPLSTVRATTTRAWDVGGVLGVGATLRVRAVRLVVDARYTHGLADVQPGPGQEATLNRSAAVTGGVAVPIPRRRGQ